MKLSHYIATAAVLVAFAAPGWADQQADEHKDHHLVPAATATSKPMLTAATSATPANPNMAVADMDEQMKRMHEMHEKMMNAKTPKERNTLMAEHMKVMRDGMDMMGKMSSQGMGSMKMKDGMVEHHKMMEKRMEMMQMMMKMMMDQMSNPSAK